MPKPPEFCSHHFILPLLCCKGTDHPKRSSFAPRTKEKGVYSSQEFSQMNHERLQKKEGWERREESLRISFIILSWRELSFARNRLPKYFYEMFISPERREIKPYFFFFPSFQNRERGQKHTLTDGGGGGGRWFMVLHGKRTKLDLLLSSSGPCMPPPPPIFPFFLLI